MIVVRLAFCDDCGARLDRSATIRPDTHVVCRGCRAAHLQSHRRIEGAGRYARNDAGIWQPWDAARCS